MARTPLWQSIANHLRNEIAGGNYLPGAKLPTEAEMAQRFGVNRHTVRHALGVLNTEGLVLSRRGAGVFVAHTPTDYPLGARIRFHRNIAAAGKVPGKRVLSVETRSANAEERDALRLNDQELVHAYHGLSTADDVPIAVFVSVFPAKRLPNLPTSLLTSSSVTAALKAHGIADYTRLSTRLSVVLATPTEAIHLEVSEGAPLLYSVGRNVDPGGALIEYGRTWFAGDRVTLTLDAVS